MAGFFTPTALEQVRAASDIVDVIGSYVPLKRAGANFTALCPFHKEKSPSFNVNPQKQIFHCFGCHKGGDVFSFVKEYENIHFTDAVRRLADRAKIPLEVENTPGQQQSRHLKDSLLQIHEQITQRWQNALANEASGQAARDYLAKRGVSADAVKLFRLGCAPDSWDDTVNWARSKGHDLALVEQGGLILKREGGEGHYDRFRGRLIFPICDEQGRVIGFSGRVLDAEAKTAKYVNSPETPIFTKGKVFFGMDKSKRALLDKEEAIICEGQLDLIACYMAGVQNVVAPQGTALTADHARILKRYVDEVVLCFDSDNAGQNAAVRSLDSLLASGLAIRVAVVPSPHDPDSFIKESGGAAFQALIEKAEGFFDYYLNRLCETNDVRSDKGRLAVLQAMAEAVHKTGNVVLVDTYAQKTALRLGVSPEAMRTEFKKAGRSKNAAPGNTPDAGKTVVESVEETARPETSEIRLLHLLFQHEELVEWTAQHLDPSWIKHEDVRTIVTQRIQMFESNDWRGFTEFLSRFSDSRLTGLLTEAVSQTYVRAGRTDEAPKETREHHLGRGLPNPLGDLIGLVGRLRYNYLSTEIHELEKQMHALEKGSDEQDTLFSQITVMKAARKKPLEPRPVQGSGTENPF